MNVLVTGASGFIGSWVVKNLLAQGFQTSGVDVLPPPPGCPPYPHHPIDLCDGSALTRAIEEIRPEVIVHLAARTDLGGRTLSDYAANVDGVRNLIAAVRKSGSVRRVLYTSSQLVCRIGYKPRHDKDVCPDTVYGESKVRTEEIVREEDGGGVEWAICRPTTVWGPDMNEHYRKFLAYIDAGRYFHIGHGKLYKSYSYIGNIAWQYYRLSIVPSSQMLRRTFYLADYSPLSLRDYADSLQRKLGAKSIPVYPYVIAKVGALLGDVLGSCGVSRIPFNSFRLRNIMTEYQVDTELTRSVCGPLPFTVDDGIEATAEWYRNLELQR